MFDLFCGVFTISTKYYTTTSFFLQETFLIFFHWLLIIFAWNYKEEKKLVIENDGVTKADAYSCRFCWKEKNVQRKVIKCNLLEQNVPVIIYNSKRLWKFFLVCQYYCETARKEKKWKILQKKRIMNDLIGILLIYLTRDEVKNFSTYQQLNFNVWEFRKFFYIVFFFI